MTGRRRVLRAIAAIVLGLLGTAIVPEPGLAEDQAASLSASFRRAASRAGGALVSIRVAAGMQPLGPYGSGLPGRFGPGPILPTMPDQLLAENLRIVFSGIVVDAEKGYVLTVEQAAPGASQFVITFPDGRERKTSQIRRDALTGLALLVVDMQGQRPTPVNWGDPAKLEPGDWLIALGQPGAGDPSMSVGIFSTRRRGAGEEWIETDAGITRMGAGGILINLSGEVVGICKLAGRRSDGFGWMGHAIPADRARRVADDLGRFGQVRRAYLGISVEPISADIPGEPGGPRGVVVASVGTSTPAAEAGIRPGDLILSVGSRAVDSVQAVQDAVEFTPPGEELTLVLKRQGKKLEIKVKPRVMPAPPGALRSPSRGLTPTPAPPAAIPDLPDD